MSTGEDLSIVASTATVAGSSVAATEAEEDASSMAGSARGNSSNDLKVHLTKEKSITGIDISEDEEDDEEAEEYAAPMHLHALRTPAKLRGARSRSSSRSRPGSRRNSASPPRGSGVGKGEMILGSTVSPAASVESSLDGLGDRSQASDMDPDILLDKLGFRDLDPDATQEELQELLKKHISSNSALPTLNERMSEETIDDVHAFQDLVYIKKTPSTRSINEGVDEGDDEDGEHGEEEDSPERKARRDQLKNSGRGLSSSAVMGSTTYLLKTLDEIGEEGFDDDDEEDEGENNGDVVLDIPEGIVPEPRRMRKNRDSTMAVMAGMDSDDDDEGADVVVEIPDGMISLGGSTSASKGGGRNNRSTMNSTAAIASASSIDDDSDEEDAEVEVPSAILNELNLSDKCKRTLKKRDTELAVAGSEMDYLEDDEQDGLEADLASDEGVPCTR